MLNNEKALQHEDTQAKYEADKFVASITPYLYNPDKTEVQRQQAIDNMIAEARQAGTSDMTLAYANKGAYDVWQSALKDTNGIITGGNNISNSHYERISGANDAYVHNIGNAQVELENIHANKNNYPLTDAYNQAVTNTTNKIAQLEKEYQDFVKSNPQVHHGTLVGNFNKGLLSFWDEIDKKKQQLWENKYKEQQGANKQNNDDRRYDLDVAKFQADINNSNGSNNKDKKNDITPSGNEIFDKNYGKDVMKQNEDGSWHYDFPVMARRLGARTLERYNKRVNESITKQQKYSDYYASIQDQIKASSNASGDNKITWLWSGKNRAGQLDDYLQKETSLTDEQKIELMKGLINNRWSFNEWMYSGNTDTLADSAKVYLSWANRAIKDKNKSCYQR